jgi:GNAT superfamily N-acetyltransferase
MQHYPTRNLKTNWRPDDGAKLAQLWNESGPGWPGGFGSGQTTAEEAERSFRDHDLLAAFVAEADDRIVAYCDLTADASGRFAHVNLLNAHPDYHGRGFGKAVLLSAVDRTIQLGYPRVILGTWPGNLKAVPLYKKAGFMWRPETDVLMESFVPFAVRHPLARPYFEKHDWYETQVRDLALHEDAHMRGKVRAYEYLWRADGDMLRMVFDRHSWGLLEIETNDVRAGCSLPDEKLIADMPHRIRWEIETKTGAAVDAVIVAQPDPGISCEFRESLAVRRRTSRTAEFTIDPDIPEKEREPFAPMIKSALLLGGQPLELAAGMEVRQAAEVGVESDYVPLRPRAERTIYLHVSSNLDKPARATVSSFCTRGARMPRQIATVDLAPHARRRFPLTLTPDSPGQVDVTARIVLQTSGGTVRAKDARLALAARDPGDAVGVADEHRAELCSERLSVHIDRGGWVQVLHRAADRGHPPLRGLLHLRTPVLGPPFAWQEFFTRPKFDVTIENSRGAAVAIVRSDSALHPGLLLERRVILTHRPVIELRDRIINTTAAAFEMSIRRGGWPGSQAAWTAVPGPTGILRAPGAGAQFEPGDLHPPDDAPEWPEGWRCFGTRQGMTTGLIWGQASRIEWGGSMIQQPLARLEPGSAVDAPPLYVFAGEGDASTVRAWWAALCAPEKTVIEDPTQGPASPIVFGIEPSPLVVPSDGIRARAFVRSFGKRKLEGRLAFRMPAGLRIDSRVHRFGGVTGAKPFGKSVRITPTRRAAGMLVGQAELSLPEVRQTRDLPLLVIPTEARAKERKEDALLVLDGGPLRVAAAPSFAGCAVSLEFEGRQMLHSPYPEHPPFMWWNPWYGGIWPQVGAWPDDLLAREKISGRFVSREGRSGIAWRGVAVSSMPKHERLRHMRLRFEYLLLPGLPVMALVVTCANRLDANCHFGIGADVWLSLGGKPTDSVTVRRADETDAVRRRRPERASVSIMPWGIVENARAACAVLLACGAPRTTLANAELQGRDGYCLEARLGGMLEPGGKSSAVFYLAFGHGARDVEPYRHLAGCVGLP